MNDSCPLYLQKHIGTINRLGLTIKTPVWVNFIHVTFNISIIFRYENDLSIHTLHIVWYSIYIYIYSYKYNICIPICILCHAWETSETYTTSRLKPSEIRGNHHASLCSSAASKATLKQLVRAWKDMPNKNTKLCGIGDFIVHAMVRGYDPALIEIRSMSSGRLWPINTVDGQNPAPVDR